MLELRPNCELCDRDLPPSSPDARICTYECTWCVDCAENVLHDVCPNCGGNLVPRPIRPRASLERHPASTIRVHTPYSREQIDERTAANRGVPPTER